MVLVFLLIFNFVEASEPKVVINEIAWMGTTKKSSDEWIELRNLSDKDIDLTGWTLESSDYQVELDENGDEVEDKKNQIKLEGKIKTDDFFLMEKTDKDSTEEKEDLVYSGNFNLSNKGESLILRDVEGEKIDELEIDEDWPAGNSETKQTMERDKNGDWQDSFVIDGTPGKKNSDEDDFEEDDDADEEEDSEENNEEVKDSCVLENRESLAKLHLNEILPDPAEGEEEWIEIYNSSDEIVSFGGCFLVDKNLYDKKDLSKYFSFDEDKKIGSGEYKVFKKSEFGFGINNSDEGIFLLDEDGVELDKIFYKESQKNFSYALNYENDWQWTEILTPGKINQFTVPKNYLKNLEITELMPNPMGVDKNQEWIELFNNEFEEVDLTDWYFANQSNQKFIINNLGIDSKQRLKIEIKDTSFSIKNNDGWIGFFNPNDELLDRVDYLESAKEEASLNKNEKGEWLWSIFSTPGEENKFNNLPTYKVKIPDKIYENVKAEFKIEKVKDDDGEDLKYRWDFGDDSRSYLKETNHTFDEKGYYTIQTRVSDLSADIFKIFKIKVSKFPKLKLRIVKILPNPDGSDSENEKIWIENQEDKMVNLKGWIMATGGSMDKLTNHYIKDDFKIKAGKTKELEREDCPFSLLNKKGRVVFKAPNGKVIDKVKYEKEKIEEDQFYYLENDIWNWSEIVLTEKEILSVLGENVENLLQENNLEKSFLTINELLKNSKFHRTNSLKTLFFENWLFAQSQNLFFKFIFPSSYQERFDI